MGRPSRPVKARGFVASLAGQLSQALLVAGDPNAGQSLVAATDLLDCRFRVVHTASKLAAALGSRVTLIHNLEIDEAGRVPSDNGFVGRMRELEWLTQTVTHVEGARVSRMRSTPEAIVRMAQERNADMAIVGMRPGRGRTLRSVLDIANCSILAIPLDPVWSAGD